MSVVHRTVPAAATWGLFVAWTVHDLEELATMVPWAQRVVPEARERYPWIPEQAWRALTYPSYAEAALSIGLVGVPVLAGAVAGARSDGRSELYQSVLAGFGLHAIGHAGMSVATRGYTPGVVTAVGLVAPYSAWAWRRLTRAGLVRQTSGGDLALAAAAVPAVIGTARQIARRSLRTLRSRSDQPAASVSA